MAYTELKSDQFFAYPVVTPLDYSWGLYCTGVGMQQYKPFSNYPRSGHPDKYLFVENRRVLDNYQLIYIISGKGVFESASCKKTEVCAGTIFMLFPGEWHSYRPDEESGWSEMWIGFNGGNMNSRVDNGFFSKDKPIMNIGISQTIVQQYQEIIRIVRQSKPAYQQLVSGMILSILGNVYYKNRNINNPQSVNNDKITKACDIIRAKFNTRLTIEQVAQDVNMGLTWFRKVFKEYVQLSPIQYLMQIRLNYAKELLSNSTKNISEIAYMSGFENPSQFSTFFCRKEGITPTEFRKAHQLFYNK